MPFENVYGNGGLLTTVGDLLKWNEHYDAPPAGDAAMIAEQQTPGRFNDGRPHGYGLGLFVGTYKGLREVFHSGSTAGYQRVPHAVSGAARLGRGAVQRGERAGDAVRARGRRSLSRRSAEVVRGRRRRTRSRARRLDAFAGLWIGRRPACRSRSRASKTACVLGRTVTLFAISPMRVVTADGGTSWELDAHGVRHTDPFGTVEELTRAKPAQYTDEQLSRRSPAPTSATRRRRR